jgi:hypothetical protein
LHVLRVIPVYAAVFQHPAYLFSFFAVHVLLLFYTTIV